MKSHTAVGVLVSFALAGVANGGIVVLDPGFESTPVSPGGFVTPMTGPWLFTNDAGVVRPYAPPSSTGVLNTWSATFDAIEGEQYASTYAGSDTIDQGITFSTAGDYLISVYAAAPEGSVIIHPGDDPLTLLTGGFRFILDGVQFGDTNIIDPGTDWTTFSAPFSVDAGQHRLGIRNTVTAPYFINYDGFSIVPEPATGLLAWLGLGAVASRRRRKAG